MGESVIHEPEQESVIRRSLATGREDSVRAAGAVLWRREADTTEVGLVHRPRYDDWTFPKGKPKNGEHILRTAVREVWEETGIMPCLGRRLPATRYLKNDRVKQVEYWAATGAASDDFVPNDEVDCLHWLPIRDAAELLRRDVRLLDELGAEPPPTVPVIILRHASAGDKRSWLGPDVLRPLDTEGRRQATELADLLTAYGGRSVRLVSSLAARCVETLIPYASANRATVTTEDAFTVGQPDLRPEPTAARIRLAELLAERRPTIICTHGELVEHLLGELRDRFDSKLQADSRLPKGGFEVAHLGASESGASTLIASERHIA